MKAEINKSTKKYYELYKILQNYNNITSKNNLVEENVLIVKMKYWSLSLVLSSLSLFLSR